MNITNEHIKYYKDGLEMAYNSALDKLKEECFATKNLYGNDKDKIKRVITRIEKAIEDVICIGNWIENIKDKK
jgi:hypothetical protein